jgi:ADP-ribosylglycohydrolase
MFRAAGALVGLAAGRRLARGAGSDGTLALAAILAEELAAGQRDLRELAHRWVGWHAAHPGEIDPETGMALAHLARHDSPPSEAPGEGSDPLARTLPVALATFRAPRVLVSATYHIAALTHPAPIVAWSAVAVNVALARYLLGKRDFVPDVIEALRGNDVPDELLAAVRRVPLPERAVAGAGPTAFGRSLEDAVAALRLAYHEPVLPRGLPAMARPGPAAAGRAGLAGALLGARDGSAAIPGDWIGVDDRVRMGALAERVMGLAAPGGSAAIESPAGSVPSSTS